MIVADPKPLLNALLQSSDDAIIETVDGNVTTWSAAAERMFGYATEDIVGRPLDELVFGEPPAGRAAAAQMPLGKVVDRETTWRHKDGSPVAISLTVRTVAGSQPEGQRLLYRARLLLEAQRVAAMRLAAIVESSEDAIVSKDLNGIIQTWNRSAEQMFGFTAEEAIGRSITIIIPPDRLDEEGTVLSRLRAGKGIEHFQTVRMRKDGRLIDISLSVSPIRTASGKVIGAAKVARDVTEQKRLTEQLETANRLKDEFLATLSHELRTPLNAVLGYTRMLRLIGLEGAKRERALEIVERNAVALSQLVSDVLDVSKIVAGKTRLDARRADVPVVALAAIDSLKPTFESKGVALEYFMDPETSPVWGDPDRLQQVVWNLLTNAVKFTPRGGSVEVRVGDVESHVEISVSDTGTGIPEEFLPRLFDRFSQADSRSTRAFGGLGLGLALVKHFVELHAGTVSASSKGLGKGATFKVRLPAMIAQRESSEPTAVLVRRLTQDASDGGRLQGLTVLAVDDDPDSLLLVNDALQSAGALVVCAGSGAAALEILSHDQPDVIVSDLSMPGMDGYQFIQTVRKRDPEHGGSIPAAALTAYARSEDRARALVAGYQTHLAKPIDPSELIATVAALGRMHSPDHSLGG